jgi:type I restriction enzyme S subunit
MSQLPNGWHGCVLGDVVTLKTGPFGSALHQADYIPNGIPLINPTHIRSGALCPDALVSVAQAKAQDLIEYTLRSGDVVMGRRGEMGRCAVVPPMADGWLCGTGSVVVRSTGAASAQFLQRYLSAPTTVAALEGDSVGSTMVNLNQKILLSLPLGLPPLPEQQRIADKLDTVLARVDAVNVRLARVAPLLKRFRQSVLAAATSGRLTADWRQTNHAAEPASPLIARIQEAKLAWCDKNSNHNEVSRVSKRASSFVGCSSAIGLPAEWVLAKLEDLVLMVVDCHNKTAPYANTGIPLIRTSNVRDGDFQWEDLRFVDDEVYRHWSKRCTPEAGDLIFTREAPMGEVAIIPAGKTLCLGQRTMLIRPLSDLVSAQFIRVAVMSPAFKAYSAELAVGTGVKHLRVGDVSELQIALPGHAEQTEIVRRVELLFGFADRLEARLQAAQTASARLTPSLLAKAFRGELVPQDPNDEPASELLKRLAQSQPEGGAKKKGRGAARSPKAAV